LITLSCYVDYVSLRKISDMRKILWLSILIMLNSINGISQTYSFSIASETGERFYLFINGNLFNPVASATLNIKNTLDKDVSLIAVFDPMTNGSVYQDVTLQGGRENNFIIRKSGKFEIDSQNNSLQNDLIKEFKLDNSPWVILPSSFSPQALKQNSMEEKNKQLKALYEQQQVVTPTVEKVTEPEKVTEETGSTGFSWPKSTIKEKGVSFEEFGSTETLKEPTRVSGVCKNPVSDYLFKAGINKIKQEIFEDRKESVAGSFVQNNCLSPDQISLILRQFQRDSQRLNLMKAAYNNLVDKTNVSDLQYMMEDIELRKQWLDFIKP